MESDSLTNRTYTALTCKLIVSITGKQSPGIDLRSGSQLKSPKQHPPIEFTLHLDHPDHGELERITLQGQLHQLDRLQLVVSKYITELVAKFPLPTINNNNNLESMRSINHNRHQDMSVPEIDANNSIGGTSTNSELLNNLPGLRRTTNSAADVPKNPAGNSGLSKLFGGWNKQRAAKKSATPELKSPHTPLGADAGVKSGFGKQAANTENTQPEQVDPSAPYLTGSERSLDRQLHLGDLANSASGDTLTLSPIQLFDLSNVLDEYAVDGEIVDHNTSPQQKKSAAFSRANIPTNLDRSAEAETTAASLSRLPNLPKTFSGSQTSQVYNRIQNAQTTRSTSRSSVPFLSAIPWAAAAAVVVGVPFLFPSQLKEATSKVKMPDVKMPDMTGVQKTVTAAMSPAVVDPEPTDLPKQWAEQPVQPPVGGTPLTAAPQTPGTTGAINPLAATGTSPAAGTPPTQAGVPLNTGVQPIQADSKPGLAPLPQTLDGIPELPTAAKTPATNVKPGITAGTPASGAQPIIAQNPLSAKRLPAISSIGNADLKSKAGATAKPNALGSKAKSSAAIKPGAVSVSTQPILLPSDLPGIGINSTNAAAEPAVVTSKAPSKINKLKVNPTAAAKIAKQKAAATATGLDTIQPVEQAPSTSVNPTLSNQGSATGDNIDFPITPIVPAPAFPTNAGGNWPEETATNNTAVAESPALKEAKRYFKTKWKANSSQPDSLQYVVQINGKSGTVKNISPQGEAATTYLQKSKFVKPGQKLVAPIVGGVNQKIRVILQPDGNVDTFADPE
jgi:Domain of unknown function (DUF4335)